MLLPCQNERTWLLAALAASCRTATLNAVACCASVTSGRAPRPTSPGTPMPGSADPAGQRTPFAGLGQRLVHRSVQLRVSWQYQRTSVQALPPSATIRSAGMRVPHIQQDSTPGDPASVAVLIRSLSAKISSPPGPGRSRSREDLKAGTNQLSIPGWLDNRHRAVSHASDPRSTGSAIDGLVSSPPRLRQPQVGGHATVSVIQDRLATTGRQARASGRCAGHSRGERWRIR